MTNDHEKPRIAILFPADSKLLLATSLEQSRLAETAAALRAAGLDVVGAPYADDIAGDVRSASVRSRRRSGLVQSDRGWA